MENIYTPPKFRTIYPKIRNSFVSTFTKSNKAPIKFEIELKKTGKKIIPPVDNLRSAPNYTQTTDETRKGFFTRWNQNLVDKSRKLNHMNS